MEIGAWIGAGVGVAGLFITIAKLIVNNTKANTRLACAVENLAKVTDDNCKVNTREHGEIWETLDEHGKAISKHSEDIGILKDRSTRKKTVTA